MHVEEDVVPHTRLHHTVTDALELLGPAARTDLPLLKIKHAEVHLPLGHHLNPANGCEVVCLFVWVGLGWVGFLVVHKERMLVRQSWPQRDIDKGNNSQKSFTFASLMFWHVPELVIHHVQRELGAGEEKNKRNKKHEREPKKIRGRRRPKKEIARG